MFPPEVEELAAPWLTAAPFTWSFQFVVRVACFEIEGTDGSVHVRSLKCGGEEQMLGGSTPLETLRGRSYNDRVLALPALHRGDAIALELLGGTFKGRIRPLGVRLK